MSVARMAVETSRTHIDGAQTLESAGRVRVEIILKEILALVEGCHHTCILHSQCRLLECCRGVVGCRAKLSAGEIVLWIVYLRSLAYLPRQWLRDSV